ncbi:hypothetical protein [Sphingomonas aliaeris]|uniref:hypothetical protein n=1 Tax=Sphingomonas aliaeris TaxID=2759526 RepID=UPI001CECC479|nr:hypothetical protein [Sphingomonas aliaeris]
MLIDFDRPETWPADVVDFLSGHLEVLCDWLGDQQFASPDQFDQIIGELAEVIRPHDILAWHCTRLTAREAGVIRAEGMFLPTVETLMMRIDAAQAEGAFPPAVAEGFRRRHQGGSPTRTGRIWFLFTRPCNDEGVADFFRFWGGEAIYAAIDRDPKLGPALRSTGIPSVVEAALPVSYFVDGLGLEIDMAEKFCAWRAGRRGSGIPHDRTRVPIPAEIIRRIITFDDLEFAVLTGCASYHDPLKN